MKTSVITNLDQPTSFTKTDQTEPKIAGFKRNRFTWLAYGLLGYYSYLISLLGPVMAFLVVELNLTYTVSSLHLSAFSLGAIISGLVGDRLMRRFGRRAIFWGGASGMGLAVGLLALGQSVFISLMAVFLMGLLGILFLITLQAALADHHGSQRGIALTEANIVASLCASLSALLIGYFATTVLGWRTALWLPIVAFLVVLIATRVQPIPNPKLPMSENSTRSVPTTGVAEPLPLVYWLLWGVVFLGVSIEWCISFWSVDFLDKVVGLDKSTAASVVGVYFAAMVIGRWAGSLLIRQFQATTLLPAAVGLVVLGFPFFWLGTATWLNIGGLFVVGLGVANLYPLTLSAALDVAASQSNRASARISSAAGLATLISPFVLGWLADSLGIQLAFSLVLLLVGLILALTALTWFKTKTSHSVSIIIAK